VLLLWAAVLMPGWFAWRQRRGSDFADLLIVGGLSLTARLGLLVAGFPWSGGAGVGWLAAALDLAGLVLLAWPFLAPPLPGRWADRLAGVGLVTVGVMCGVAVWQVVRSLLPLPPMPLHPPVITWAYSVLTLGGLAWLNLSGHPVRRQSWWWTAVVALVFGFVLLFRPFVGSSSFTAFTAALAAGWLNWLARPPRGVASATSAALATEVPSGPWRASQWLEASTALFVAPDLSQLLKAAKAVLARVVDARLAGLLLVEENEPQYLRLVARCPPGDGAAVYAPFPRELTPLLADTLARGQIADVARDSGESLIAPLDRVLGIELRVVLVLPLMAEQDVRGLLVLDRDGAPLDAARLRLCGAIADQVAIAVGYLQLRVKIVQQAQSLARLIRRYKQDSSRLLIILESIPDGIVVSDTGDKMVLVNRAALEILGMRKSDVVGTPFGRLIDRPVRVGDMGVVGMVTENSPYSTEIVFEIAGRAVQASMAPVESSKDAHFGVVTLLRDVTALIRADDAREQALLNLQVQNRQLKEAVEHLWGLIWADKMELVLGDVDLQELIEDAVISVRPLTAAKPVTVVQALEFGLPVIQADKTWVRQVLLNLLTNAIKYTEKGQVAVSAARGKGYVVTSVAQVGTGISPQYAEAVYEEFGKGNGSAPQKVDGLRLGLSVSRRMVELHGGRTWVRKGKVVTVYFGLPIDGPYTADSRS
jgi:PAS domain S-box-containing protein